jgi:hypothetical protein
LPGRQSWIIRYRRNERGVLIRPIFLLIMILGGAMIIINGPWSQRLGGNTQGRSNGVKYVGRRGAQSMLYLR